MIFYHLQQVSTRIVYLLYLLETQREILQFSVRHSHNLSVCCGNNSLPLDVATLYQSEWRGWGRRKAMDCGSNGILTSIRIEDGEQDMLSYRCSTLPHNFQFRLCTVGILRGRRGGPAQIHLQPGQVIVATSLKGGSGNFRAFWCKEASEVPHYIKVWLYEYIIIVE